MKSITGIIKKLKSVYTNKDTAVQYFLGWEDDLLINSLIGQKIEISLTQNKYCIYCNNKINKFFGEGSCYPCFIKLACNDICMVKPEKCHFHLGTCRQEEWGKAHCFKPHIVYLSLTSNIKVGITRKVNIPHRWIDQGAIKALAMIEVPNRYMSGIIESHISRYIQDKTNWIKMLSIFTNSVDLYKKKDELIHMSGDFFDSISTSGNEFDLNILDNAECVEILYPVTSFPDKIRSINLEKDSRIQDTLLGIKGQYLIFSRGVINWRKYTGYEVELIF